MTLNSATLQALSETLSPHLLLAVKLSWDDDDDDY